MSEEQPNETVKVFKPIYWNHASFDDSGKLTVKFVDIVVREVEGKEPEQVEILKYAAVVFPDYRVAIKIPFEANMPITEVIKAMHELLKVAALSFKSKETK